MEITAATTLTLPHTLQLTSILTPLNSVSPPPIKSRHLTSPRRTLRRTRRRTRRPPSPPSPSDDDGDFFGGGGSWNFNGGNNNNNWNNDGEDWFFSNDGDAGGAGWHDPAFDFVFEVVCWIVFSNCLHFAFTKVVRLVSEGRGKVAVPIASVC